MAQQIVIGRRVNDADYLYLDDRYMLIYLSMYKCEVISGLGELGPPLKFNGAGG